MAVITLFSAPKPFTDAHISVIQRNAIRSWTMLPDVDVILLGDEAGLAEAAQDLGVKHLANVARNEMGTPLISSMFELARQNSQADSLCIINADILLMPDFLQAARTLARLREKFVLVSQRWDLDVSESLAFPMNWDTLLRNRAHTSGQLHRPSGSDFFLFPRTCYEHVPDFAIGRAGWDNWMIYRARQANWPVIDGTASFVVIHQNHDYRHLPGGQSHYNLPETNENIRLAGGEVAIRYTILDSTLSLVEDRLVPPRLTYLRLMRIIELFLRKIFFFLPEKSRENIVRPKRWKKRFLRLLGNRKP